MSKLYNAIRYIIEILFNIPLFFKKNSNNPRIVLLLTPQYLNYGDHAIAVAERLLLKQLMPDQRVLEINFSFFQLWPKRAKALVGKKDTLLLTGGGYIGNLWPELQKMTNQVLTSFPDNKIIFAPQTIYFKENSSNDIEIFSQKLKQHGNIYIIAREERTYQLLTTTMHRIPGKECYLAPDMALFLIVAHRYPVIRKKQLGLCLRNDRERSLTDEQSTRLSQLIKDKHFQISQIKMAIEHIELPIWLSRTVVYRTLKRYAQNQIIITDRLHGMIFAAITATPCIAFDNISKKISGVYHWIQSLDYIKIVSNIDELEKALTDLEQIDIAKCQKQILTLQEKLWKEYIKTKLPCIK